MDVPRSALVSLFPPGGVGVDFNQNNSMYTYVCVLLVILTCFASPPPQGPWCRPAAAPPSPPPPTRASLLPPSTASSSSPRTAPSARPALVTACRRRREGERRQWSGCGFDSESGSSLCGVGMFCWVQTKHT